MKLPIGLSAFDEVRTDHYQWVDKSLFIKEIIDDSAKAILITRPRRFGKTLNLSMLYHFLSNHPDHRSQNLFNGLAIEHAGDEYQAQRAAHPTLFISLRDLAQTTHPDDFWTAIQHLVQTLYLKFEYLKQSTTLQADDLVVFERLSSSLPPRALCMTALTRLMRMLHNHWNQRVWLLIDECDAPIFSAYESGYFDEAISFLRLFLCAAIKDNDHLAKAVMTGIFRVAKESLFSGLNNLEVHTLWSPKYANHFGFTEDEVCNLLHDVKKMDELESVKRWYNGYHIGQTTVYNPWSIIKLIKQDFNYTAHWVNTHDNGMVKRLLSHGKADIRMQLEHLLNGNPIHVEISEFTTFQELDQESNMVWHWLFFAGYLTGKKTGVGAMRTPFALTIPNLEVRALIEEIVKAWLTQSLSMVEAHQTVNALLAGDVKNLELGLKALVLDAMSFWDTANPQPERVYHAFMLGLLVHLKSKYLVRSNRESGYGRYDVMLIPKQPSQSGVVLEFKSCDSDDDLNEAANQALHQIGSLDYAAELRDHGVKTIHSFGIAFCGKKVAVAGNST